jgi:hypothetical protein
VSEARPIAGAYMATSLLSTWEPAMDGKTL